MFRTAYCTPATGGNVPPTPPKKTEKPNTPPKSASLNEGAVVTSAEVHQRIGVAQLGVLFYDSAQRTATKLPNLVETAAASVFTGTPVRTYVSGKMAFPNLPLVKFVRIGPDTIQCSGLLPKLGLFGPVRAIPSGLVAMVPTRGSEFMINAFFRDLLKASGHVSDGSATQAVLVGVATGVGGIAPRILFQGPGATFNTAVRVHGWRPGLAKMGAAFREEGVVKTLWKGAGTEAVSKGTVGNIIWYTLYERLRDRPVCDENGVPLLDEHSKPVMDGPFSFISHKTLRAGVTGLTVQGITDLFLHPANVVVGNARALHIPVKEAAKRLLLDPLKAGDLKTVFRNAGAGYGLKFVGGAASVVPVAIGLALATENAAKRDAEK